MKIVAIIPARYASTRFPGKPLADLNGKPLILHVYEAVLKTELFDDVIVATDEVIIFDTIRRFGGRVMKTLSTHKSGTDRIEEVCRKILCDVVVNVQGDEPFINKKTLQSLIAAFNDTTVQVASLCTPIKEEEELHNPNTVKVVTDLNNNALYFSRATIPFNRDDTKNVEYLKHIGVYAYRKNILMKFPKLPASNYENIEKLEQLRFLENGIQIKMIKTDYEGFGIDTPQDLEKAKFILQQRRK